MSNVLHKPRPLPSSRLRSRLVFLVLVFHVVLLGLISLVWPLQTAQSGSGPNTQPNMGTQVLTKMASNTLATHQINYQVITDFGRQRFGRAETKLALPQIQTSSSTTFSQSETAAPLSLSEINIDIVGDAGAGATLKLSLASSYIDQQVMGMVGASSRQQILKR